MNSPLKMFKKWRANRKLVRDSQIQIYASRTTTFPLEQCNSEQLLTAANFNKRKARMYSRRTDSQRHRASAAWNQLASEVLEDLSKALKPGQRIEDLPIRKRKEAVQIMLRLTEGKAK